MTTMIESKLQELLQFAKKHGLAEMVWKDGDVKIAFRRGDAPAVAAAAAPSPSEASAQEGAPVDDKMLVRSPMVGTFRRALAKGRPPLVMVGNHIKPGEPMAVVECMKIPTDVVSFAGGEVKEILVEDGQAVEYGQPLFSLMPNESASTNGAS